MSIESVAAPVILVGNGFATEFAFPWLVEDADHLNVYWYDTVDEEQVLLDPVLYSVNGVGDDGGGSVTYPVNGGTRLQPSEWLIIEPAVPYTQEFSPTNQRDYLPAALEGQLDHTTRQVQQLKDRTDRMPLLIQGETFERQLTRKADIANKVLGFDDDGEPVALDPGSVEFAVPGDGTVSWDKLDSDVIATEPEVLLAVENQRLTTPALLRTHQEGYGDRPSWYGIAFDGASDDDAGWVDAIGALNAEETKSLFLHSGTSIINTAMPAILANDVTIAGHLKSSRLLLPEGSGNLGTFFTVGDADTTPARFGLSGVAFQCVNVATLDADSGHAIYLRAANRATLKDIEVINTAGFLRCGDGTIGTTHGIVTQATVENIRGTVRVDAGTSIYHFERMNASYFGNCTIGITEAAETVPDPPESLVAPVMSGTAEVGETLSVTTGEWEEPVVMSADGTPRVVPDTFAGMKFIPAGGEECDGNIFYALKINFGLSGPHCSALLIDVSDGAVDNTRFTDCTLDLGTKPIVHIRCGGPPVTGHHDNSQVTRLHFLNCRLTPSLAASDEHLGGNENPALFIENAGDVPMPAITFKSGILGMARGPAVLIEGVANSTKTSVSIIDTAFNDRVTTGGGEPKPCVQTNLGGLSVQGCSIMPAEPDGEVEVTYMVDFTAAVTPFSITGNDASLAESGPVNTANLTPTIQRGQNLRGNLGPHGLFQADRRVTTTDATNTTIAQIPLADARSYVIHVKHLAVKSDGTARQYSEGIFEFHRTGGGDATPGTETMIVPAVGAPALPWPGLTMGALDNFARVNVQGAAATTVRHAVIVDVLSGAEAA